MTKRKSTPPLHYIELTDREGTKTLIQANMIVRVSIGKYEESPSVIENNPPYIHYDRVIIVTNSGASGFLGSNGDCYNVVELNSPEEAQVLYDKVVKVLARRGVIWRV